MTEQRPENATPGSPADGHGDTTRYEIRVRGHLAARWATWFDGLTLTTEADGTTVLAGSVIDQAALHGLLQKLRDLGLPLISLTPIDAPTNGATSADERN